MDTKFDIDQLALLVKNKRGNKGLRAIADEIGGVSASTLSRIEQGKIPDLGTFTRLCQWLQISPERFMGPFSEQDDEKTGTPDVIAAHLRADRALDPQTAEALAAMIRGVYDAAVRGDLKV